MFPPMLLYVRVSSPGRPRPGVWLPLFLVWLFLLPLFVLAVVVTAIIDVVLFLAGQKYHHYTLLLFRCLETLGATRGTVVNVHAEDDNVVEIDLV